MYNCSLLKLKDIGDKYGHLTPIEARYDIPFEIKRIYYISGVGKEITRGFHAHRKLHQVLICVSGQVSIRVKNPKDEEVYILNKPYEGLYIGSLVWREMFDFSEDAVLLVIASEHYDESDYIRNYDFYVQEATKLF